MIMGMNTFRNLLIPLGTLILALVIIGGAAYAYEKGVAQNDQNDSLISSAQNQFRQTTAEEQRQAALAQAQASLQSATVRLNQLRSELSPAAAIADAYDAIDKAASSLATAALPQNGAAASEIAAATQSLADTLQAWKILISTIPPSGPSPSQIAQAEQYAQQAQTYLNQIQTASRQSRSVDLRSEPEPDRFAPVGVRRLQPIALQRLQMTWLSHCRRQTPIQTRLLPQLQIRKTIPIQTTSTTRADPMLLLARLKMMRRRAIQM